MKTYKISGKIIEMKTRHPLAGLRVMAYDRDLLFDDYLGSCETDENGKFSILFDESRFADLFERQPDVFIRVVNDRDKTTLVDTRDEVRWNVVRDQYFKIEIPQVPKELLKDFVR